MPTIRYQIKNEYGLADPALYGAADKDDPEALLEGVAMAGLVGILRQLGDLAEFAAEIFHDLHEEVMATSSRGHGLLLRVQQLEAEFPTIEKDLFNNPEQSEFNTSDGINWHPNLQIDQNMVTREDMPRFILDCYEESRGPPRLFMLDKFDSAEEGACLKRYSDPSFFKTQFASTENMEGGFHRERRSRNTKKKVPHQKNGITPGVQNPQLLNNKFEHSAIEKIPENQQINYRRLKRRHLNENMNFGRSYMQSILGLQSAEGTEFSTNSSGDSQENIKAINSIESSPPVREIIVDMPNGTVNVEEKTRPEYTIREAEDLSQLIQNMDSKEISEKEISKMENSLPTISINDIYKRGVSESSQSKSSSSLNDYRTDDVASELDNYLDALATMESEIETDSETRTKLAQNNLIKDYPNSGLCVEKTDTSKSKSYSEEISCDVDEKLLHDVAKLLVSESSSEVSPINIMDRGLDAEECNETASSNKLIASQASENETSSCSADSATPAEANSPSAESDGFSNGMKSETNDESFNCEVMPPVSSEVPLFETDMVSGDLEQESEQDVKIANADQFLRAGNLIIKFPDSREDQYSIKLPTDDGSHETIHDDPIVNESNGDCGTMHVISDVKSASYSHMGNGDSLLQPPNIENQEEQQRSISQASMEKSRELTPVDDRSSTGSTEGLFEVKRNCFSQIDKSENAGFSNCSDIVGGSENDDVSAENSRDFIENDVMNSGVPNQESFVSNHEKLTPNDWDLESSYEQKSSNVVCALESSSSSSSSYQDIVLQVKTIKLEDNLPLSNESKCALSSSESESILSEDQSQFDSLASKAQMEAKNHQLSETLLPHANDAMAHESSDQTDEKLLKDVSLTDLDSKVKLPQSSDKSSLNSTKDDVVNNPIDQMDEKLSTNVSPHNLSESNVEILGSCEMSSPDSTKPIDPMDKELLAIVCPEDIEAKKRFLQLPETSNIHFTKTDAVHEPIGQMDNKILATIFSPEDSESRQVQSCEPSSFEPIKDDQNSVRHLETNKADSHSSTCQLSREEPEAGAFTLKEVSTDRVVDKSSETFFPEKYEKEENRLERAGSGISSPKASQVLSEAVERGIDIHDSTRTSSITLLQYSNQRGLEIPKYGLPSIHKETQVFDEDPPPPPLPPMKWRMGRFNLGSPAPMFGIQPTLSPSLEDSSGPKLSAKLQSLPADSSIEREVGSSSSSHESPKIEVHQEGIIKETHDSNTKYAPQLLVIPSTTPESSSLLSPPTSSEADRMLKDKIIDGYFSDTSFATEAIPQGLLSYQGFYMYASDGEPFMREEYQNFVKKPSSLLNRPRDPLIEAVASHDKSTLRRVSELTRPSPKPEGERNNPFLEQIRSKSFNLRPAAVAKPTMKAPPTNLKVAAILEKANAIRQAVAGSDEDEDGDSWSDS